MRLVEDISFAAGAVTCSGGHVEAVFTSTTLLMVSTLTTVDVCSTLCKQ